MSDLLPCTDIVTEIIAERRRQMDVEGWTVEHDDAHVDGSLASAAACYAAKNMGQKTVVEPGCRGDYSCRVPSCWPQSWTPRWWKPKDRRRDLIRAAALIVAEIERLDRAAAAASNTTDEPIRSTPTVDRPRQLDDNEPASPAKEGGT